MLFCDLRAAKREHGVWERFESSGGGGTRISKISGLSSNVENKITLAYNI